MLCLISNRDCPDCERMVQINSQKSLDLSQQALVDKTVPNTLCTLRSNNDRHIHELNSTKIIELKVI